jgi:hypothetical protein
MRECHEALPTASGGLRHYCQSCAAFNHLADDVKAAQPHPNLQSPTGALGLSTHKILKSASGPETDIVMGPGSARATPMLRSPKRTQNPPLMRWPSCGGKRRAVPVSAPSLLQASLLLRTATRAAKFPSSQSLRERTTRKPCAT